MITTDGILTSPAMGGKWLSNTSKTNISPSLKPSGRKLKRFGKESVGMGDWFSYSSMSSHPPVFVLSLIRHRQLDHPNLCKFIGGSIEVPYVSIITEYCPKGSLSDVLLNDDIPINWGFRWEIPSCWCFRWYSGVSCPPLCLARLCFQIDPILDMGHTCKTAFFPPCRLSFATDIARGMSYLHQHKVFHGRLHSRNCVIDDRWVCKISGKNTHYYLQVTRHTEMTLIY